MLLLQYPKIYKRPLRGPRIFKPNATTMTSLQYKQLKHSMLQSSAVANFIRVLLGFELGEFIFGAIGSSSGKNDRDLSEKAFNNFHNTSFSIGKAVYVGLILYSNVTTRLPGVTVVLTYTTIYKILCDARSIIIIVINHSSFQDSYWELIHTIRDWLTDILKIVLLSVNVPVIFYIPYTFMTNVGIDSFGTILAVLNWLVLVLETYSEYSWLEERDRLRFGLAI